MGSIFRILDANANRAREALRVLEDVARFVLEAEGICQKLKGLRHELTHITSSWPQTQLINARDTPGDVGTSISTPAEGQRPDVTSLIRANSSRLTEALRVLEESSKLAFPGGSASRLERLRYEAYDVEIQLLKAVAPRAVRQYALCVLITESLCKLPWLDVARGALDGGADCLQIREKAMDGRELLNRTRQLVRLVEPYGAAVFVNDRPDVALLGGAHGVHLGQGDVPCNQVRRMVGRELLIGVSTQNLAEAHEAVRNGADVCGIGPMYTTTTKQKPIIAGPQAVRAFVSDETLAKVPHLAIGGITPARVRELREAGCRGVAVSSCVCGDANPQGVCEELRRGLSPAGA